MCVDRRFFTAFFLCLLSTPPLTGVGTRHYYRKLGYELEGPYMVKTLVYERDEADDYEYWALWIWRLAIIKRTDTQYNKGIGQIGGVFVICLI